MYVPTGVPDVVIDRISAEGALLTVVDADYDGAVLAARADAEASADGLLIQDTAWDGYEQVPSWIVAGYETLFAEIDAQLAKAGAAAFGGAGTGLVSVPVGVGSLAQAAVAHYRRPGLPPPGPPAAVVGRARHGRVRAPQPGRRRDRLGANGGHGDERAQLRHPVLDCLAVSARRARRGDRRRRRRRTGRGRRALVGRRQRRAVGRGRAGGPAGGPDSEPAPPRAGATLASAWTWTARRWSRA